MKLQTPISLNPGSKPIDYDSSLLLIGSCFSEHMGRKFDYFKFRTRRNPFGILFHPEAIENLLTRSLQERAYTIDEVHGAPGRWFCFDAHSDLIDTSREAVLQRLNGALEETKDAVEKASHIILTLGTAWVYRHRGSETLVANCHKVPQREFTKELRPVGKVIESLENTLREIRKSNPSACIILTISPVRHLKDGAVENQRGKSHLIAAVHTFLSNNREDAKLAYFEGYELLMDELRDYRFYAEDMVHPNALAIDYIWEKFLQVWVSPKALPVMKQVAAIQRGLAHRPFQPDSGEHQEFLRSLRSDIERLRQEFPHIQF